MAQKTRGNMLIAQSGGPTVVINRSLVGAIMEARKHAVVKGIYGSRYGIRGILTEDLLDLKKESPATLRRVAATPSAALGSVRKKPTSEECAQIFEVLRRYDIRYFFYIGGNDSAETAWIIAQNARNVGYEFHCFHIPKTIDNDLRENDHTPGYGSAAKFVACALIGDDLDNRALPGVKVDIIMGRHAGFLTAAAALARSRPDDGPHLIYVPERPFSMDTFLGDVDRVQKKLGRCVVAVSEGIADESGTAILSTFTQEKDAHGNVQLSGTGALGDLLAHQIKTKLGISRVRADTLGYLQRSFPGMCSSVDVVEAEEVGRRAVQYAVAGEPEGSVAIRRKPGKKYTVLYECIPLEKVARETRSLPPSFIARNGHDVTPAFVEYARPLVGKLPETALLKGFPARRRA